MTLVSDGAEAGGAGAANPPRPARPDLGERAAARLDRRELRVATEQTGSRCVLRLHGRLCSDTVATLDAHVDGLWCRWCDEVVVDLEDLRVLDLVGARVVVGLSHYVAGRGGRFRIEGASPFMESMLERAGVELAG